MGRKAFKKKITTPELIDKVNPINIKLADIFLKKFESKRSKQSAIVYQSNLNIFFVWNLLNNDNKAFTKIKRVEFINFLNYCINDLKWSSSRYDNMLATISSFSSFIETYFFNDFPAFINQVKKIERLPPIPVRKKTVLTEAQINSLLNYLVSKDKLCQSCFIALAICSGAEMQELVNFDLNSIDLNEVTHDGIFIKMKYHGKRNKITSKYVLKNIFEPYYKAWLKQREHFVITNRIRENRKLFIRSNGNPISKMTVDSWMRTWGDFLTNDIKTNPNKNKIYIYPYCFTHYLFSYLIRIGLEKKHIIDIMGWDSDDIYNMYNDLGKNNRNYKNLERIKISLIKPKEKEYDNTIKLLNYNLELSE